MDKKKIEKAIQSLLEAVGEDPQREGLKETPKRVANFYEEALAGMKIDPAKVLNVYYEKEEHEEIVLLRDISLYSLCEHHLLPFFGKAHIAYIPKKERLLGLSKVARLVEILSHRLQLQERLTKQIADTLMKVVQPLGVLVVIEAEHFCLTMRGVKKPGSLIVTSAIRGIFMKDAKARAEALSLIKLAKL
ncbi:MAG TPA: GTP cyclohydrolase I FolE [Elusimicrobia bacterium]|nr:GTP cyclohydrolase I FolE [Elusimicrobiota bacterium]